MYTHNNFKSKKDLKVAVEAYNAGQGPAVHFYQPGLFGVGEQEEGTIYLEGPHFPQPHRWHAQAVVKGGCIVKVK